MTFDELDRSLPNGFHDAWIKRIEVDYVARKVSFVMEILVGLPEDPPGRRSRLRDGLVVLEGMEFIVIEPPTPGAAIEKDRGLWVDSYVGGPLPPEAESLPTPADCFLAAFYVDQLNSCMCIAARDARHQWIGA